MNNFIKILAERNCRLLFFGLIVVSILALFFAFLAEYVFSMKPCPLCVYERFPYLILIFLSSFYMVERARGQKPALVVLCLLIVAASLSSYHVLVERGIVAESNFCKIALYIPPHFEGAAALALLGDASPSCAKDAVRIIFFTLTEWNALLNFALAYIVFLVRREKVGQ